MSKLISDPTNYTPIEEANIEEEEEMEVSFDEHPNEWCDDDDEDETEDW